MKRSRPASLPATAPKFGLIEGGPLDGWFYAILQVEVEPEALLIAATRPGWFFPRTVRLTADKFDYLRQDRRAPAPLVKVREFINIMTKGKR